MKFTIIKRGRNIQVTTTLVVLDRKQELSVDRRLQAGVKSSKDGLDDFMATLMDPNASVEDCFAAAEDRPELDPVREEAEVIASAKQELIAQATKILQGAVARGKKAQQMLDAGLTDEGHECLPEPGEGQGICRVCKHLFPLHYIGGTTDLCMEHINPSFT